MTCDDIQTQIMETDSEFSDDIKQHIKTCNECQNFANDWELIKTLSADDTLEPPPSIEFAIKSEAAQFTQRTKQQKYKKAIIFIATAACFAIAIWIAHTQTKTQQTPQHSTPAKLVKTTSTIPWDDIDMTDDIMNFASTIEIEDEEVLSQLTPRQRAKKATKATNSSDDFGFSDDGFSDSDDDILLISDYDNFI